MEYIFDVDGTLADSSHRLFLAKAKQWDLYYSPHLILKDAPIQPMINMLRDLIQRDNTCFLVTGRRESCRSATEEWFANQGLMVNDQMPLMMRPDENRMPSDLLKKDILNGLMVQGYIPVMAFDDRPSDARMYRNSGIICFLNQEEEF